MAITNFSILAAPSGKLGGLVFSHNRGGQYIRQYRIPTNPNTQFQQEVRSAMAILSTRWNEILTAAQRAAWELYALNVPLTNRVGVPVNVGGIAMFNRSNVPRIQSNIRAATTDYVTVDDAPTIFDIGSFGAVEFTNVSEATQLLTLGYDDTDPWCDEDASGMIVSVSRPMNPSINYFNGPYRWSTIIGGNSVTPPTSPASVTLPFPVVETQKVFASVRVTRADGRLSGTFRGASLVSA